MPKKIDLHIHEMKSRAVRDQLKQVFNGEILIRIDHDGRNVPVYIGGSIYSGALLSDELCQRMARFSMKHRDRIGEIERLDNRFYHQGRKLRTGAGIITTTWSPSAKPIEKILRDAADTHYQGVLDLIIERNMCVKR